MDANSVDEVGGDKALLSRIELMDARIAEMAERAAGADVAKAISAEREMEAKLAGLNPDDPNTHKESVRIINEGVRRQVAEQIASYDTKAQAEKNQERLQEKITSELSKNGYKSPHDRTLFNSIVQSLLASGEISKSVPEADQFKLVFTKMGEFYAGVTKNNTDVERAAMRNQPLGRGNGRGFDSGEGTPSPATLYDLSKILRARERTNRAA